MCKLQCQLAETRRLVGGGQVIAESGEVGGGSGWGEMVIFEGTPKSLRLAGRRFITGSVFRL